MRKRSDTSDLLPALGLLGLLPRLAEPRSRSAFHRIADDEASACTFCRSLRASARDPLAAASSASYKWKFAPRSVLKER